MFRERVRNMFFSRFSIFLYEKSVNIVIPKLSWNVSGIATSIVD